MAESRVGEEVQCVRAKDTTPEALGEKTLLSRVYVFGMLTESGMHFFRAGWSWSKRPAAEKPLLFRLQCGEAFFPLVGCSL